MTVAVLFCDPKGVYSTLPDLELWPESRDARKYDGPYPVICHSPCARWCQMAKLNERRWGCKVGADGGCFASALDSLRNYGGCLEHPAHSLAWTKFNLIKPPTQPGPHWMQHVFKWEDDGEGGIAVYRYMTYWVCRVFQSAYGHPARKETWLLYCGELPPFELDWRKLPGTHQIGGGIHTGNNRLPKLSKKEASATPLAFAQVLIELAKHSQKREDGHHDGR